MNECNISLSDPKFHSINTDNEIVNNLNKINPAESDDSEVFQVEKIVGCKFIKKKKYFKIRWQGYGPEEDTWEPESNLIENANLLEMLDNYSKMFEMDKKHSIILKKPKEQKYIEESLSEDEDWFGIKPDEKSRETRRLYVADRIPSFTEKILAEIDPGVRVLRNHLRESIPGIGVTVKNIKNKPNNIKRKKKINRILSDSSDEEQCNKKKRPKNKSQSRKSVFSLLKTDNNTILSDSSNCLNNDNVSTVETSDVLLQKNLTNNEVKLNIQKNDQNKTSSNTSLFTSKIKKHINLSNKDNKILKQKKTFKFSTCVKQKTKKINDEFISHNTEIYGKMSDDSKSKSSFINLNKIKKDSSVTTIVDSLLPFSSISNDLETKIVNFPNKRNIEKFSTKSHRINECHLPILVNFQEINTLLLNEKILEANQN